MSIVTASFAELVVPDYERDYGIHSFPILGSEDATQSGHSTVSVVSQPDWESFYSSLCTAPPQSLGEIALGPELITFPGRLESIPHQRDLIEHRVDQLRGVSEDHPRTTFVFGTPTFNDSRSGLRIRSHRPANSVLFVQEGEVVAQHNKQYPSLTSGEKTVFTFQQEGFGERTIDPSISTLICADVIGEAAGISSRKMLLKGIGSDPDQLIDEYVTTVLLSGSWATPIETDTTPIGGFDTVDDRFRHALEGRIGRLFRKHPNVREIIVSDRVPEKIDGVMGPYNGRFTPRLKQM